jgi:hypothetical protein
LTDNVWSEVGRCAACHSPDRNQKQVEKNTASRFPGSSPEQQALLLAMSG